MRKIGRAGIEHRVFSNAFLAAFIAFNCVAGWLLLHVCQDVGPISVGALIGVQVGADAAWPSVAWLVAVFWAAGGIVFAMAFVGAWIQRWRRPVRLSPGPREPYFEVADRAA